MVWGSYRHVVHAKVDIVVVIILIVFNERNEKFANRKYLNTSKIDHYISALFVTLDLFYNVYYLVIYNGLIAHPFVLLFLAFDKFVRNTMFRNYVEYDWSCALKNPTISS